MKRLPPKKGATGNKVVLKKPAFAASLASKSPAPETNSLVPPHMVEAANAADSCWGRRGKKRSEASL